MLSFVVCLIITIDAEALLLLVYGEQRRWFGLPSSHIQIELVCANDDKIVDAGNNKQSLLSINYKIRCCVTFIWHTACEPILFYCSQDCFYPFLLADYFRARVSKLKSPSQASRPSHGNTKLGLSMNYYEDLSGIFSTYRGALGLCASTNAKRNK